MQPHLCKMKYMEVMMHCLKDGIIFLICKKIKCTVNASVSDMVMRHNNVHKLLHVLA